MTKPIRLIVADIDGCFTAGGRSRLDLNMCKQVQAWNERSKDEYDIPALVFCTGRPLPYIQAMKQAAGCYLPSIAEFGAVVWCPVRQSHYIHPMYSEDERRRYEDLLKEAEKEFGIENSEILIEAGKLCQLTLYPRHPAKVEDMRERVETFHERWRDYYVLDRTPAVMNFMPQSINKGTALEWLAEFAGIGLDRWRVLAIRRAIGISCSIARFQRRRRMEGRL